MESWRTVWRAFASAALNDQRIDAHTGLTLLAGLLRADDPHLVQGATTQPPPLMCVQDWPCEAGDCISMLGVLSGAGKPLPHPEKGVPWNTLSVGDAEEFFARACFEADQILGTPAACRWFLNWYDDTPRAEMRACLIPEINYALDPTLPDPALTGQRADLTPITNPGPITPF